MNLDGIRSMKLTQLQPRYVLIIPSSDDAYAEMVKGMNQEEVEIGWSEYQEFKQVNRENPGYFDMVIPADTVEQAHIAVRDLVKDFLGMNKKVKGRVVSRKNHQTIKFRQSSYVKYFFYSFIRWPTINAINNESKRLSCDLYGM